MSSNTLGDTGRTDILTFAICFWLFAIFLLLSLKNARSLNLICILIISVKETRVTNHVTYRLVSKKFLRFSWHTINFSLCIYMKYFAKESLLHGYPLVWKTETQLMLKSFMYQSKWEDNKCCYSSTTDHIYLSLSRICVNLILIVNQKEIKWSLKRVGLCVCVWQPLTMTSYLLHTQAKHCRELWECVSDTMVLCYCLYILWLSRNSTHT